MVAGLAIDLGTRKRVKIYGRMVAGALGVRDMDDDGEDDGERRVDGLEERQGEIQLVVKVDQSLGTYDSLSMRGIGKRSGLLTTC